MAGVCRLVGGTAEGAGISVHDRATRGRFGSSRSAHHPDCTSSARSENVVAFRSVCNRTTCVESTQHPGSVGVKGLWETCR